LVGPPVEAGDVEVREYFGGDGECLGVVVDFSLEVALGGLEVGREGGGRREREVKEGGGRRERGGGVGRNGRGRRC
jgi:hypothetical protein